MTENLKFLFCFLFSDQIKQTGIDNNNRLATGAAWRGAVVI